MKVFVTGASGFIGMAVTEELIKNGHEVTGLARSDGSAQKLETAGVRAVRGSLEDLDVITEAAAHADGVIHLAFIHDFINFQASADIDRRAIGAIGDALEGSGKPLVSAAGVATIAPGKVLTEDIPADPNGARASETATLALADRGVRASALRLPPSVHGDTDMHGFIPTLISVARDKALSGYPGDGNNRWPAVHVQDAAVLFRLALESAPAGSRLHAIGDEGIESRDIAAAIGEGLGVPSQSVAPDDVDAYFGWIGRFFSLDAPASAIKTRELLGWEPTHPGLLDDLAAGFYFR